MSFFVQSTAPPQSKTKYVEVCSIALAVVFVMLAVAQLYSYEEFPDVIASLWLPGGRTFASLLAALIVVLEVAAIPFLLSMWLSPAMRIVSMVAGWLAATTWIGLSVWANVSVNAITNSVVLGATIPTATGWWQVLVFVVIAGLLTYISWSKWPLQH